MSTILIWVMLIGALLALRAAHRTRDWPWLALPIGLYAGWLTAASCVALATVAAGYGLGSVQPRSAGSASPSRFSGDHDHPELPRADLSAGRGMGACGHRRGQLRRRWASSGCCGRKIRGSERDRARDGRDALPR
jgi:hypothetical protein